MPKEHPNWGGKREGAGRKTDGQVRNSYSIRMTKEERELVRTVLKEFRADKKKEAE